MTITKVSIMIPTYNQSEYIEQSIDSALLQDYPNLEVVISDDSTNSETENIIKNKYLKDSRVHYYHNTPALGRVKNYHKTLYERTTGDYVLNMDGDDWLIDRTYISKAAKVLDSYEKVACVFAKLKRYNEDNKSFTEYEDYNKTLSAIMKGTDLYYYKIMGEKVSINHLTLLYRKSEALKVGFYDADITFSDAMSFGKLIYKNEVGYIDKVAGVWRAHSQNASSLLSASQSLNSLKVSEILEVEDRMIEYYGDIKLKELNYKQWTFLMRFNSLYPYVSNGLKQYKILDVLFFVNKICKYNFKFCIKFILKFINVFLRRGLKRIVEN